MLIEGGIEKEGEGEGEGEGGGERWMDGGKHRVGWWDGRELGSRLSLEERA